MQAGSTRNETIGLGTGLSIVAGEVKISTLEAAPLHRIKKHQPWSRTKAMDMDMDVNGKARYAWLGPWQTRSDSTALTVRVMT
jgi:hypothetical protein